VNVLTSRHFSKDARELKGNTKEMFKYRKSTFDDVRIYERKVLIPYK